MRAGFFFSLSWLLAVLGFMAWHAKPLDLWGFGEFVSAIFFFCVFGLWGVHLGPFIAVLFVEFGEAVVDGYHRATKGRELGEAELK